MSEPKMLVPTLLFLSLSVEVSSNSAACPQFGSYTNSSDYSSSDGLFLSIDSPSQCYGRVTQWNFCYQRSSRSTDTYGVRFMVYRQSASTSVYYRLSNSLTLLQRTFSSESGCTTWNLNQMEQFDVESNDIIAACMINRGSIEPLRVSSQIRSEALLISSVSDDCRENNLQALDMSMLNSEKRNILLVEAVINSSSEFRAGNSPKGSSSSTLPGIYVNQAFPADSTGYVTSWNYCYYTSNVVSSSNYTAMFAVWRNNSQSSPAVLSIVSNSATFITLQPQYTIATIFCKKVELEPERYFPIMEGDYVGVVLPLNNAIPLIGTNNDYNILVNNDNSNTASLSVNNFQLQQRSLHLYADIGTDIGNGDSQTTAIENGDSQATQMQTTDIGSTQNGGTSEGVVAAIVIVLVIVGMAIIGGLLIIIFIVQRKLKTSKIIISGNMSQTVPQSFDNINYSGYKTGIHDLQPYETLPGVSSGGKNSTRSIQYEPKTEQANRVRATSMLEASNIYASVDVYGDDLYSSIDNSISQGLYSEVDPSPYQQPHDEEQNLYSQIYTDSRAENIDKDSIKVFRHLGSGQSGSVDEGIWFKGNEQVKVAVKCLRDNASSKDKVKFLQEAVIMAQFKHENVIRLLGMVLEDNPIVLVMELASRGDLRKNLLEVRNERTDRSLPKLLLYFSRQIAFGMNYLSSRHFVHRDLAARNILLSDNCICKIADFGLSRDLEDENYYKSSGGMVPVKWTAPEAIKYAKYSTASDVWSYGCVLYEIWSLGHKPFEKYENLKIIEILNKGTRLPPPTGCSKSIYATMINCWHPDASKRPSFRDLVLSITKSEDILKIPEGVLASNPDFQTPGGDLNVGVHVYEDLQKTYI